MMSDSQLVALATGTSTPWPTSSGQGGLRSIALSGGTASAAATFTAYPGGANSGTASGAGSASFVLCAPANGFSERRFVAQVAIQLLTASVASNGACDVEFA